MSISVFDEPRPVVLAMWIESDETGALEEELRGVAGGSFRCLQVLDDGIIDVLVDVPTASCAHAIRNALSLRLEQIQGSRMIQSWIFGV